MAQLIQIQIKFKSFIVKIIKLTPRPKMATVQQQCTLIETDGYCTRRAKNVKMSNYQSN